MSTQLPALYEIVDAYRVLADKLADLDLDEQTISDTLEGAAGELEAKALEMGKMIRNWDSLADQINTEAQRLSARAAGYEKRSARVKLYVKTQLERAGVTKIPGVASPGLAIKENPASILVDNPAMVPDEYKRIPQMPMPEPDKAAIKTAINAGVEVPGARLLITTRLEVR